VSEKEDLLKRVKDLTPPFVLVKGSVVIKPEDLKK